MEDSIWLIPHDIIDIRDFLKYSILFITQNNQGTKIFKKKY